MAITDVPAFTHLTDADIENLAVELDAIRQDIEDSRGERDSKLHPSHHRRAARSRDGGPTDAGRQLAPIGVVGGHRDTGRLQDHREHGDRPQRHARPVGLDERSRDSLLDVGVGHERVVQALAVHPQLHAPQVHQHPRHGRRRGLRRHPGHPRSAVEAVQPLRQPAVQHASRDRLRVGRRPAAPGTRQDLQGPRRPQGHDGPGARVRRQGRPSGGQGLRRLPGADGTVARRDVQVDAEGQRGRQRHPQRVGQRGDLLRPLPRRRREVHQDRHGRRDQGAVVPAADARKRQLRGRPGCCGS